MESDRWERIESLFHDALERPAAERGAWLDESCGGDPGLRAEVAAMLEAHASTSGLGIERALSHAAAAADAAAGPAAGARVGAWRLVRPLGRGGMGEVWLAERADGVYEQRAAIKFVRLAWRSGRLVERFRRERQLLARLAHPNIARLLDGGTTADGEPFLAMEFVAGEPITAWCDARGLGIGERLALFRTVCEAVRFAHANLVVHRDLKPGNILVTGDGRPVLLDFGIAKLLEDGPADTDATRADDRLLTPEHAAPEQVRGEAITTATDVWGLGVLLHELLTGERPFRAPNGSAAELARLVTDTEPRSPSEAVRAAHRDPARREAAERAARCRGTAPELLARALRGDLDAIVGTALRKEPERRYRSAEQLGEDVGHHLDGLPVRARPDAASYRLRKFVARHRAAVAAGAALALALVAFGATSAWQARRIAEERDRARAENARAERVLTVLVDVFRASDPRAHPGGDTLRVRDLIALAESRIGTIEDEPLVQSRLWETVAEIHSARSELREQRASLDRALAAAQSAGAEDLAIRIRHAQASLSPRLDGAEEGERRLRASLAETERRYGPRDDRVATALQDLGNVASNSEERRDLLERALALRRELHPEGTIEVASSLNGLGAYWLGRSRNAEARRYYEESLALMSRLTPETHPDRMLVAFNVANCDAIEGRFEDSNRAMTRLIAQRRAVLGARTTAVAACLFAIGQNLMNLGRHEAAAESLAVAQDILTGVFGPEQHAPIGIERFRAVALVAAGRRAEGLAHARHALGVLAARGPSAESAFLGLQLASLGATSAPVTRATLDTMRAARAPRPKLEAEALLHVGTAALARGDRAEAAADFAEASAMADTLVPATHPLHAAVRLGRWLAAGSPPGAPVDSARAAFAIVERWGMRPPGLAERARAALAR